MIDIRDSYFFYEFLRKALLFGLRTLPIRKALSVMPGETILDAGCGYGLFANYSKGAYYTGIDSDPKRIQKAKECVGESEFCRFLVSDVIDMPFSDRSFDKILGYGLLHHLSDSAAKTCVREISRVSRGLIVFSEPVFSHTHIINNIICKLDSGRYVRDKQGYIDVCNTELTVLNAQYFHSRNGLAKYLLIMATSKEAA
jgi:SAM-dependent methyltransferase